MTYRWNITCYHADVASVICFGGKSWNSKYRFDGIIDEVRIWNIPRTQNDIQSYMYTALAGDETGLIGYWNFDDGSGDIAVDMKGNDGTLNGSPEWVEKTPSVPIPSTLFLLGLAQNWETHDIGGGSRRLALKIRTTEQNPKDSLKSNFAEMRRKYDVDSDDLREQNHSNSRPISRILCAKTV